jgi:hypothetical protein
MLQFPKLNDPRHSRDVPMPSGQCDVTLTATVGALPGMPGSGSWLA